MKGNSNTTKGNSGFDHKSVEFNISVPPSGRSKDEAWEMIMQAIESEHEKPARIVEMRPKNTWMLVAASIVIVMVVGSLLILNKPYRFETQQAQTMELTLPDGSVAHLNANSWITYSRVYGWFKRQVKMDGEAYFKVKSGKGKFAVTDSRKQQVVVTGTEFTVLARANAFEVKCFEGSVKVKISGSKPVTLQKGEGVVKSKGALIHPEYPANELEKPAWVTQEFRFNSTPLSKVFEQLSDFYKIEIKIEGIEPETRYFTGTIPAGTVTDVFDVIALSMGLKYTANIDSTVFTFRYGI